MIKGMNKKGQEGGVSPLMIGLVIVGVLAVFIVLFVTGVFDPLFKGTNVFTPSDLDFRYNSCTLLPLPYTADKYCEFTKITNTKYLNCNSPSVKARLVADGKTPIDCSQTAAQFCVGKDSNILVNEISCKDALAVVVTQKCLDQTGDATGTKAVICATGKCAAGKEMAGPFSDVIAPQVCCKVACTA